jgi:predicted HicB family RNase H-like nuclease
MTVMASRPKGEEREASQIVGFRLPKEVATALKVEAATRHLKLNALLIEMWELYRKKKRAG